MAKYIIISLLVLQQGYSEECFGGEFRTIESYTFGRYEVNMKPAYGDGYVSSFFTYHDFWETNYGNWQTFINEIDIEFTGNNSNSIQFTTHHPGSWSLTEIVDLSFNPFDSFHTYAIEWTPSYVKWFVDGNEIYSQEGTDVIDLIYPQKVMLNLWASTYNDWVGEWSSETMPVYSYYDFIKYYAYNPDNGNYGSNNNFIFEWEDHFNTYNENRWDEATHGFDGNHCHFSPYNTLIHNGKAVLQTSSIDVMLGDTNTDGLINISDIITSVNIVLGYLPPINSSDYNQDNYINIIDIVRIVENILG